MGTELFHSELAGHFIVTLGFICPFLYLDTTLSSILQGLGMAGRIFFSNVVCLLIRLAFVFFAIPQIGMQGYLWGILASQLVLAGIYFFYLYRFFKKVDCLNYLHKITSSDRLYACHPEVTVLLFCKHGLAAHKVLILLQELILTHIGDCFLHIPENGYHCLCRCIRNHPACGK